MKFRFVSGPHLFDIGPHLALEAMFGHNGCDSRQRYQLHWSSSKDTLLGSILHHPVDVWCTAMESDVDQNAMIPNLMKCVLNDFI